MPAGFAIDFQGFEERIQDDYQRWVLERTRVYLAVYCYEAGLALRDIADIVGMSHEWVRQTVNTCRQTFASERMEG